MDAVSLEDRVPKRAAACRWTSVRRGLSRAIDADGAGVLRQARADRTDALWCAAPALSSPRRPTRRRRTRRLRVRGVRHATVDFF